MNTPGTHPQLNKSDSSYSLTPSQLPLPSGGIPQQHKIYNYQNTYIIQQITKFEKLLSELTTSVERFDPNPDLASALVSTVDQINNELVQQEIVHDLKKDQVTKQNSDNKQLNDSLRTILIQLNECRRELNDLPKLSSETSKALDHLAKNSKSDKRESLEDTKQLLEYAMKLAKFSKIPRAFDGFLLPNNFVWPGDDNMRRGMLATASLMGDKLIKAENGEEAVETSEKDLQNQGIENMGVENEDDEDEDDYIIEEESNKEASSTDNKQPTAASTNMDLFDSDEDD